MRRLGLLAGSLFFLAGILPLSAQATSALVVVLDARGSGSWTSQPIVRGQTAPQDTWLLSEDNASYEMSLNGGGIQNGAVRLQGRCAFAFGVDPVGKGMVFRVFSGQVDFFVPHTGGRPVTVLTPSGRLLTFGAEFSVAVSADDEVAVSCRRGRVGLVGPQNAVAQAGFVVVADRDGRGRRYSIPLDQLNDFMAHWQVVANDDAGPVLRALLPERREQWNARQPVFDPEQTRYLALWFWKAQPFLGNGLPDRESWMDILKQAVTVPVWEPRLVTPGLLGERL